MSENIKVVSIKDKEYPKLLREIHDPPAKLFYKGNLKSEEKWPLAVVGTRRVSFYGREITGKIVRPLARKDLTIISGLAIGIDTLSHRATLEVGGRTIAVLGSGVDEKSIYPRVNIKLAREIVANGGAVISEFEPGTGPLRGHFPVRNRVISGLSLGTLVIEAPKKSGALITASCALEHGRDVFAVPGNINSPNSYGPNLLIKQGAYPVTEAKDILEIWGLGEVQEENKQKIVPESKEEEILLKFLNKTPIHIDELAKKSGLDIAKITTTLTIMEMRGKVNNIGSNKYIISN